MFATKVNTVVPEAGQSLPNAEIDLALEKRGESKQLKSLLVLGLLLLSLGSLRLLWPGDVPFINDEARLIDMALKANAGGESMPFGLMGTRNIRYGPFPIWIYRLLLTTTHDLVAVSMLRVLLVTIVTSISIVWIALTCRHLRPTVGAAALLSPYLWFYSRQLWDNSFCISLTALGFAAYLAFCRKQQWWTLSIAFTCLTFLFLTHLMALAVILPFSLHFLFFYKSWWRSHWWMVLIGLAAGLLIAWPYLAYLLTASSLTPASGPDAAGIRPWLFALLGGRFFTVYGLDYFLGKHWYQTAGLPELSIPVSILGRFTGIALIVCWIGLMCCGIKVIKNLRRNDGGVDFHACLLSIAVICSQIFLNVLSSTCGHPHYYNATWIYTFLFFWTAVSLMWSSTWLKTLFGIYSVAMASILLFVIISIHQSSGNRELHYGATLANQIAVARELDRYDPSSTVKTQVKNIELFPHAIAVLQRIYAEPSSLQKPRKELLIRYTSKDRTNGMIELLEMQ